MPPVSFAEAYIPLFLTSPRQSHLVHAVHNGRAHHDSVRDASNSAGLLGSADTEADRQRLVSSQAYAPHEVGQVVGKTGPCPGYARHADPVVGPIYRERSRDLMPTWFRIR